MATTFNSLNSQSYDNNFVIENDTAGTTGANLHLVKRGAFPTGVITTGDTLGNILFYGDDSAATIITSKIVCTSSGAIAANRIGSNLEFWTHRDAAVVSVKRMTIDSAGAVLIGAPEAGVGLTIAGGGLTVTGPIIWTSTTVAITASAAAADAISLEATDAAGGILLQAGTGGITIGNEADTTPVDICNIAPTADRTITISGGAVATAAVTDTLDLGVDGATGFANAIKTVNVGTGALDTGENLVNIGTGAVTDGTHTVSISSGNVAAGTATLNLSTGTGGKNVNMGNADGSTAITIDGGVDVNLNVDSAVTINTGTSTGTVSIGNGAAGAITVDTAAGISLDAATASNFTVTTAANDLTLESTLGTVIINAGEDTPQAIYLHANGGVTETIELHADLSTAVDSINLLSDVGGITLTATGNATADAININAPAGGIDIDASADIIVDSAAAGISLDGVTASNFTVTGAADLTLDSTAGSVTVSGGEAAVDAVLITATDAGGGVTIDAGTTGIIADAVAGPISLDAGLASNFTVTGASEDLSLLAAGGSVEIDGSEAIATAVNITASDAAGGVTIAAGSAGVLIDATAGAFSLDAALASNITVTGAGEDLTLASVGGSVVIDGSEAIATAVSITASDAAGGIDINAGSAGVIVDATAGAISLDSALASNFTVTGAADLTLNTTLGSIVIDGGEALADAVAITASNAAGGIDLNAGSGGIIADAVAGAISLDSALASNFTVTGAADLTLDSTAGSVVVDGGEAAIDAVQITASDAAGGVDINAGTGGITVDSGGVLSLDGVGATNLTTTGAFDLNVQSTLGSVIVTAGEAAVDSIQLTASDAAGGIDINSGTNGITVDAVGGTIALATTGTGDITLDADDTVLIDSDGVLELNSSAGIISIGNDAVAQDINIGTGGAARTITIGNGSGASAIALVSGTGNIDIGVNGIAHDIVIGNSIGATSVAVESGTGAINIGVNAIAHTTTIGNGIGASSVVVDCGTGVAQFAANATEHATTVGSNTAASATTIDAGTGDLALTSVGDINFSSAAAASTGILDANGARFQSVYRVNAVRTGGAQAVGAAGIVLFDAEGFDPGADYDVGTGVFTAPATGIYRISAVVNCTDVVGGGTKTITLRDGGAGTNYFASATVGNTELGSLSLDVLWELTAADTIDIYYEGGAGDTVDDGSHLMVEFAYNS